MRIMGHLIAAAYLLSMSMVTEAQRDTFATLPSLNDEGPEVLEEH